MKKKLTEIYPSIELCLFLVLSFTVINKGSAQSMNSEKIDSLISQMTLEEKIGQLTLFTSDWATTGPTIRENYLDDIRSGKAGNIFNAHSAAYNEKLQRVAVEESRLGIPLLFGYDVIHGYKTIFPIPLAEAASWDLELIEKSARIAAIEATAGGLHWTYAPMVDIARDPRWGRVAEGAGEDVYLGSLIAGARVRGFQGEDLSAPNTLLACAKHFAAYGAAQGGRDYNTVDISRHTLWETYLPPFKACLDAGVATFMTSFNELDGIPASANTYLLQDILRGDWGFKGFVVSDYTSINEMVAHGYAANDQAAAMLAFNAGVDMDMQGAVYYNYLKPLLERGTVAMEAIDESVRRILKLKNELGLFDDPYRYSNEQREKESILSEENKQAAREIARNSMVLLENKNQTLPLSPDEKIALIGPLIDSPIDMLGSWHGSGQDVDVVTLLNAFINQKKNFEYAKGCEIEGADTTMFDQAIMIAKNADKIVVAVGEHFNMSGEAASRAHIRIPEIQQKLIKRLASIGKPLIVILINGRPLCLPWEAENADAMLEAWQPGTMAGPAIADVLYGDHNPSGKLPITFPVDEGQIPLHYNMKNTGRPMDPNQKYTSKYLDMPNVPLYPFGYGLSYTTFTYSNARVDRSEITPNDSLHFTVAVSNTGNTAGHEIVQLYMRDLVASITRPVKELKRFAKIYLEPGESQVVDFTLTVDDLKFYNSKLEKIAEAGDFLFGIGKDSDTELNLKVTLK